jgi:hypothetical protein
MEWRNVCVVCAPLCAPVTPMQLLAQEGGLPEAATKSSGVFSSIVIVRDGHLLSDTGESRLVPPPPTPMAPYDAKELGLVRRTCGRCCSVSVTHWGFLWVLVRVA